MKKREIKRRKFLKGAALASAASIMPEAVWASKVSPSDTVGFALIGCRGRGFNVLKHHLNFDDTRCVAICDVDENILNKRAGEVQSEYNQNPAKFKDYRKMLEHKDIDAVIIGTPDHWHCLNLVHSVQAGKDVYVEKPMANTIEECNVMVGR
jgi:predicted dehydrogenase